MTEPAEPATPGDAAARGGADRPARRPRAGRAAAGHPGGRRATGRRGPRSWASSTTTCCRGCGRSTPRCWRSWAARPAPASRRWSTPWWAAWSASPGCCARRPGRPCWSATPTTWRGSTATGCCPTWRAATVRAATPGAVQIVTADSVPRGLAIMDAPDIDSVELSNRALASQLLAAADLWLFVTSAARYADQVPWEFLRAAAERSAAVAIVLDRTPPAAVGEVTAHLREMMDGRGLDRSPLFTVAEARLDDHGLLPSDQTAPVSGWLHELAADADARAAVVRQTLDGRRRVRRAPLARRRGRPPRPAGGAGPAARRRRPLLRARPPRGRRGLGRRQPAARGAAGAVAGVRRRRRPDALGGVEGRLAARPRHRLLPRPAGPGRPGHLGGRDRPGGVADRARRGRRGAGPRRLERLDDRAAGARPAGGTRPGAGLA